ncbi:MAG: Do family serine endopeptidase [Bauldia sp.]|nr:Do family serine endopeptidase [Bauldia sp.]
MTYTPLADTRRRFPRALLFGTATAALIAGAVIGGALPPATSALAEPVTIEQPVELPSFADVVEAVGPAVVGIRVRGLSEPRSIFNFEGLPENSPLERFFEGLPDMQQDPVPTMGLGSGFFVSEDGYVVTNNHVVDDATEFTIIMNDGAEYPARLIGTDPQTDLALLKVDAEREFTYVQFAPDTPRVGDWVLAVGTPFGLGGTVTAGIVSANGRQISNNAYDDFLQIDAAINRGNSGGPTFNLSGEVVGIATAIYSPTGTNVGIAFAVPADVAAAVIDDLRDHGAVLRGWLGVTIQSVSAEIASALDLPEASGALVSEPADGSPADEAGVEIGDVILRVDEHVVADSGDLARTIGAIDPDTEVTLTIWRDGAEITLPVVLGTLPSADRQAAVQRPPVQNEPAESVGLGMAVGTGRGGQPTVADLNRNGLAAAYGLRPGDAIIAINNEEMETPQEVVDTIEAAREAGREAILFRVERNGTTLHFAVPL